MEDIEKIRDAINRIDSEILKLLAERNRLILEIKKSKSTMHKPIFDPIREEEVLNRVVDIGKKLGLNVKYIQKIYKNILENSIKLQRNKS